jgi:hypothetical protein
MAWGGFCLAVLWQAAAGWGPFAASPALVATAICLGVFAAAAIAGLRAGAAPLRA